MEVKIIARKKKTEVYEATPKDIAKQMVDSVYLHSFYDSYRYFSEQHEIPQMNVINNVGWDRKTSMMIKRQKEREQQVLSSFDVSSVQELNERIALFDNEMISSKDKNMEKVLVDTWLGTLRDAMGNLDKMANSRTSRKQAIAHTEKMFDDLAERYQNNVGANTGILGTKQAITRLLSQKTKKEWLQEIKKGKYFTRLATSVSGEFLEQGLAAVLNSLNKNKKIKDIKAVGGAYSGEKTATNKQLKTDIKLIIGEERYGIQTKRYSEHDAEELTLSWFSRNPRDVQGKMLTGRTIDEVLDYFNFTKIDPKMMTTDLRYIQNIAKNIQNNAALHYQITNELFLSKYDQNAIEGKNPQVQTPTVDQLQAFLQMTLPYFMGSQLMIAPDINVDFFNINGRMVPVSDILATIYKNIKPEFNIKYNMDLYLNNAPNAIEFLQKKRSKSISGTVYTEDRLAYGSRVGQDLYDRIRIGRAKLKLNYNYIRSF